MWQLIHINRRKIFFWKYLSEKSVAKFIDKSQKHKIQELIHINNRKKEELWLVDYLLRSLHINFFLITLAFRWRHFWGRRCLFPVSSKFPSTSERWCLHVFYEEMLFSSMFFVKSSVLFTSRCVAFAEESHVFYKFSFSATFHMLI